jgi:hypothetical protein
VVGRELHGLLVRGLGGHVSSNNGRSPTEGGLGVCGLIYYLAASPGSPLGPGGPIGPAGPAGPGGPAGPAGPGRPQFCITTSLLSSPEVISTMQVEGNSGPIQRNPPVELLSTCTVLLGLILICTLGSRGRLILPTITRSPPDMAAVVINTSARAFPPHVITQAVVTATTARISFASMASPCVLSEYQIRSPKPNEDKGAKIVPVADYLAM